MIHKTCRIQHIFCIFALVIHLQPKTTLQGGKYRIERVLGCKMQFFGEATEKANNVGERIGIRGPRNLLELLPDTFSREDATRIRRQQGLSTDGTAKMISQWKTRGYILQLTVDSFQKQKH